ncbi:uncharacterized protein DNG_04605, partial [Cephalotrichum gorgonifer]
MPAMVDTATKDSHEASTAQCIGPYDRPSSRWASSPAFGQELSRGSEHQQAAPANECPVTGGAGYGQLRARQVCEPPLRGDAQDISGAIDLLVRHGADINLERSTEGTPLLTACSRGRLEAVKMLVGYGASVTYKCNGKVRSGVAAAARFPEIQRWLLVGRYTERRALGWGDPPRDPSAGADPGEARPWSGIWSAAYRLQGTFAERRWGPKESRVEWLERAAELRRSFAGSA